QGLLVQRQGQVELAGGLVGRRQVVHDRERLGVVGAQPGLAALQGLLEERQGSVHLTGGVVGHRPAVLGGHRLLLLPPRQLTPSAAPGSAPGTGRPARPPPAPGSSPQSSSVSPPRSAGRGRSAGSASPPPGRAVPAASHPCRDAPRFCPRTGPVPPRWSAPGS